MDTKIDHLKARAKSICDRIWAMRSPPRFKDVTWDKVPDDIATSAQICVQSLFSKHPHGIFIIGPVGTGKTSLLRLIQREYYKWEIYCMLQEREDLTPEEVLPALHGLWITHRTLIKNLRENETADSDGYDLRRNEPMFLDDFGRGYDDKYGWNVSLQFAYFDWRWSQCYPLFISSNLTRDELRDMGQGWDAIVDRFADPAWMTVWELGGKTKRKPQVS